MLSWNKISNKSSISMIICFCFRWGISCCIPKYKVGQYYYQATLALHTIIYLILSELMKHLVHPDQHLLLGGARPPLHLAGLAPHRVQVLVLNPHLEWRQNVWRFVNQIGHSHHRGQLQKLIRKTYFELFLQSLVQRLQLGRAGVGDDRQARVPLDKGGQGYL